MESVSPGAEVAFIFPYLFAFANVFLYFFSQRHPLEKIIRPTSMPTCQIFCFCLLGCVLCCLLTENNRVYSFIHTCM